MKRLIALILSILIIVMLFAVPGVSAVADNSSYKVGDIIEYGYYPQSDVTSSMSSVLDSQEGEWKSYKYFSGTGNASDGKMKPSDYMQYKDVTYLGEKYRAVRFTDYRPMFTGQLCSAERSYQDNNGYISNKIYWFKYEPIKWRVLDPATGFVMCNSIIDSQAYNNVAVDGGMDENNYFVIWGDTEKSFYASNYARSSIRDWLNNEFYNLAFSDSGKQNIEATVLNNACYHTLIGESGQERFDAPSTEDKIFLLSYDEIYGENTYDLSSFEKHNLVSTSYAKCQGYNAGNAGFMYSEANGYSVWWMRTPYGSMKGDSVYDGEGGFESANETFHGVVPAMCLAEIKNDTSVDEPEEMFTANFVADDKIIATYVLKAGATIPVPQNPSKEGQTFIGWTPSVPDKMPQEDMVFTAVFSGGNPVKEIVIYTKSESIYKGTIVTLTATADGLSETDSLALYEGDREIARGNNKTVTKNIGEVNSDRSFTVKVIDKNGKIIEANPVDNKPLEQEIKITVKTGFLNAIIAFFRKLFRINTMEVSPV